MKVELVPGDDNDKASLFLNPALDATEPVLPYVSSTANPGNDVDPGALGLKKIVFRAQNASGDISIDELRVGTTWADVATSTPTDPTTDFPPMVTAWTPGVNATVAGSISHVTVNFNEAVTGVAAGNLTVNGSPAT